MLNEDLGRFTGDDLEWFNCREEFHELTNRSLRMLFNSSNLGHAKRFITRAEQILKLPNKQKIVWKNTDKPDIAVLYFGEFWKKSCPRNLLTILLRQCKKFTGNNFWEAAKGKYLYNNSYKAFEYFMDGNTKFLGNFSGWVNEFVNKEKDYKKFLVKGAYLSQ